MGSLFVCTSMPLAFHCNVSSVVLQQWSTVPKESVCFVYSSSFHFVCVCVYMSACVRATYREFIQKLRLSVKESERSGWRQGVARGGGNEKVC